MLYIWNRDFSQAQRQSLGHMYELYGRYTGLLNACLERKDLQEFGLYWFQTLSTQSSILFDQTKELSSGGLGVDVSSEVALQKSFGEAMERHSLAYYNAKDFTWGSPHAIGLRQPEVPIQSLAHLFDEHPEITEYYASENENIAWVAVEELEKKISILYPAGQVYMPCHQTKRLSYITSTGVAFNKTRGAAILSGLLEIIERDSIVLNHYFTEIFQAIEPTSLNSPLVDTALRKNLHPTFLRLYSETNIPVILCFLDGPPTAKGVIFGIGCSAELNEQEACDKALREALFTYNYANYLMHLRVNEVSDIKSLYERFLYYQDRAHYKLLRKRYKIGSIRKVDTRKVERQAIRQLCQTVYRHIYVADITPPYLRERGYVTTRLIIPEAYDLHTREIYFNPKTARAKQFILSCKEKGIPTVSNPVYLPHPMP